MHHLMQRLGIPHFEKKGCAGVAFKTLTFGFDLNKNWHSWSLKNETFGPYASLEA